MSHAPKTLFDKVWDSHVVTAPPGEPALLYIDLHLIHEVSSPQAFDGLRLAQRKVRVPHRSFATIDHSVPTTADRIFNILDPIAARQIAALRQNCADFGIDLLDVASPDQGIVHVIGPELGLTKPGMTIVCGDSHASTHGAFGALAFGIGTSEVEHVLALQCLPQSKPKSFRITIDGKLHDGVTAKDIILRIIAQIGTAGATGYVIEYAGEAVRSLSMEARMTLCNMSIEAGARAGMVAPDEKTFAYLKGRRYSPRGDSWDKALYHWRSLPTHPEARFDRELQMDASCIAPHVTWGTNPGMALPITASVPEPPADPGSERAAHLRALEYMNLTPGMRLDSVKIDRVFIGSCTNSRIEDLRSAAAVVCGYHLASGVRGMVVPGSQRIKVQAESEGLHRIFLEAGFEWREAGCSMCLGMNPDALEPGERCASTSNRNFEGRQGRGGRSHLLSPAMAAAAAITGHLTDVRGWDYRVPITE